MTTLNKSILMTLILLSVIAIACKQDADISPTDAKDALTYLNQIRTNPSNYSKEFGVDLSDMEARPALTWNDTLALVAQAKAEDMAKRNYFNHVDPNGYGINHKIAAAGYHLIPAFLTEKSKNNFESLGAGHSSVKEAIKKLIIDKDEPGLGHRYHLLGQGAFWSNCYDVGIGAVKSDNSDFPTYYCFIIAKHKF